MSFWGGSILEPVLLIGCFMVVCLCLSWTSYSLFLTGPKVLKSSLEIVFTFLGANFYFLGANEN